MCVCVYNIILEGETVKKKKNFNISQILKNLYRPYLTLSHKVWANDYNLEVCRMNLRWKLFRY